jgi:demethylmenaquinone methyltransferase / 2-methoxy-6-polyprenyl-1,4-benzoquinol methylase
VGDVLGRRRGAGGGGLRRRAPVGGRWGPGYAGGRAAAVCQGGHMTRAQLDKRPGDVAAMFDKVAPRYDLLNDVLSLGQDRWWRKVVAKAVGARPGERVLDLAAGTGTSSVTFTAEGAACVACDFSLGMLRAGVERLGAQDARAHPSGPPAEARPPSPSGSGAAGPGSSGLGAAGPGPSGLGAAGPGPSGLGPAGPGSSGPGAAGPGPVRFVAGDALRLPFGDQAFDAVTISFGLRNVADPDAALADMFRVTRPGGRLVICEFGHLPSPRLDAIYGRYLMAALPAVARRLSPAGDAYEYLAESIRDWPSREELAQRIGGAGWSAVRWRDLTLGVVTVHTARRRGG